MLAFYLTLIGDDYNKDKLTYIYNKYLKLMLAVAEKYCNNKSDVEDIVGETFLKVIKFLDNIDISNDISTKCFLCTMVKNRARDVNKRARFIEETDIYDIDPESDENVLEAVISADGYQKLVECILLLDDKYRDVYNLRYVSNLSERDVSEILGISINTVGVRVLRAKSILVEMLVEKGVLDRDYKSK